MKRLIIILLFLILLGHLLSESYAYQMVIVRNVSNTEKTFLVGIGAKDGITDKMEGTFSNDNIGLVAKAVVVNREESVWKVKEEHGKVPFAPGQTVTFNFATERVWLIDPDTYLDEMQYKHEMVLEEKGRSERATKPINISVKTYGIYGVNETVSVQNSNEISSRSGFGVESFYNRYYKNGFQLGVGGRFEQETTESKTITVTSNRILALGSLSYFFRPLSYLEKTFTYTGTMIGVGEVQTQVGPMKMVGQAYLFPSIYFGVEHSFSSYALLGELSFETITTKERFSTGDEQDSSLTNAKLSIGLSYFLQ